MLRNGNGFSLALGQAEGADVASLLPLRIRATDQQSVDGLRTCLVAGGVPLVEEWDEPHYVSVKCRDPDGYVIEAAWETPQQIAAMGG
jgi:hypothetical protein